MEFLASALIVGRGGVGKTKGNKYQAFDLEGILMKTLSLNEIYAREPGHWLKPRC